MGNVLTERMRAFGGMLGRMFGGARDLYAVFGYHSAISYAQMLDKFVRQDIAARIVEAEPRATWSNPPEVTANTAFDKAWKDLVDDFDVYEKFNRADKLCGVGRYSVILVGYRDGLKPDQPVRNGKNEVIYLQPYSEVNAEIIEWEDDPQSPQFGMPRMYQIRPGDLENSSMASRTFGRKSGINGLMFHPFNVHRSRVLHIAENIMEDNVYGYPRMQRVFNLLDDLLKTVGGSAETFWLTSNRGLQVDVDKEMDLKTEDAEELSDEIDEYMHNLRRVIRTKGVKINNLGSDVADPRGTFGVIMSLISGATGIPQRILLGSEAGQLASEQDRANWATRIEERRNLFANPIILKRFIKMQIENGALPKAEDLKFLWPDAFRQNPLERAQTSAQKARSLANVSKALSDTNPVVSVDEGRSIIGVTGPAPAGATNSDAQDGSLESDAEVDVVEEVTEETTSTEEEETS